MEVIYEMGEDICKEEENERSFYFLMIILFQVHYEIDLRTDICSIEDNFLVRLLKRKYR